MMRSLPSVLLVVAALGLATFALITAYVEGRPLLQTTDTPRPLILAISTGEVVPGFSTFSQKMTLDDCTFAMQSTLGQLLPGADRQVLASACSKMAVKIIAIAPASSYAWFVEALAQAEIGDTGGMNQALQRSQATGPFEQWVATNRVALAEQHYANLTPDVRAGQEKDLMLLVRSQLGIRAISQRYVSDASFRDRITAIVEGMAPQDQANFLAAVRNASGAVP